MFHLGLGMSESLIRRLDPNISKVCPGGRDERQALSVNGFFLQHAISRLHTHMDFEIFFSRVAKTIRIGWHDRCIVVVANVSITCWCYFSSSLPCLEYRRGLFFHHIGCLDASGWVGFWFGGQRIKQRLPRMSFSSATFMASSNRYWSMSSSGKIDPLRPKLFHQRSS